MNIKTFVQDWLEAANRYDTDGFVNKFQPKAILDDPSVGRRFAGHAGIRQYFEDYFIGYKTQTKLSRLDIIGTDAAHVEVVFTGQFPGSPLGGLFELTFSHGKIKAAKADLTGY